MKLRIVTSMLLIMFLSVGSASVANAHEGCGGDHYCCGWGHGWGWGWGHHWGCNNYIYGPDGLYAHCRDAHKSCCDKDKEKSCEHEHSCCEPHCTRYGVCDGPRYHRAYYYEDCHGWGGHLHFDCEHHCDKKDKDSKNDD